MNSRNLQFFKNALFLSNFTIDMGDPNFRTGAYTNYLEPLAKTISKVNKMDIKFLVSKHVFESIRGQSRHSSIKLDNCFIVDYKENIEIFGVGDWFIRKSYNSSFNISEEEKIIEFFNRLFGTWKPDLIMCWEFPTTIFRKMFPEALIIDLMPGLFMRPPYPKTLSFDPVGLYKDSCFRDISFQKLLVRDEEIYSYYKIRDHYMAFFEKNEIKNAILSKFEDSKKYNNFWLVPLQVSNYFGFYENCNYQSQFDFLIDVLSHAPGDTGVIVTQYVSDLIQEKAINDKNIHYLLNNYPNFLYTKDFENVNNISQFIVPWADVTCSISSTIGLQAKFFGRKLISPSRSHLSYFADHNSFNTNTKPNLSCEEYEKLMAIMLNRQMFLEKRLLEDPLFLINILTEIAENKLEGKQGVELLPTKNIEDIANKNPAFYFSNSSFHVAVRQISRVEPKVKNYDFNSEEMKKLIAEIKSAELVSFDVFDTLLCRTVYKPEDVFLLMQKRLEMGTDNLNLPRHFVQSFAELRAGIENELRRDRDIKLKTGDQTVIEEITIIEVYNIMVSRFARDAIKDQSIIEKLINIEQEIEMSVIKARQIGKILFDVAKNASKPIIMVSDFIHDEKFVENCLVREGYIGYTKLYVSSEVGKKKHSGNLFKHIIKELGIAPQNVVHIGDNKDGDFQKAIEAGLKAARIPSSRENMNKCLLQRNINKKAVENSFYLRTVLSMFAEEFLDISIERSVEPSNGDYQREIIESGVEFGFLALGPVLFSFSEWVIDQARKNDCNSIIYLARDCYLPFLITQKIVEHRGDQISVHYIHASRQALTGINILSPNDVFDIRIDDFSKNAPFLSLLKQRFGINPDRIPKHILSKWNIDNIEISLKEITHAAVYGVVFDYLTEEWDSLKKIFENKRNAFKKYLTKNKVDFGSNVLVVDFGYKGTIHRMLKPLFRGKFIPTFFITYENHFGEDPIDNAICYYLKNINPSHGNMSVFISHNLIIETLLNQPIGSLVEVVDYGENDIQLIREDVQSFEHISKINSIHHGAIRFASLWLKQFNKFSKWLTLEHNMADFFLDIVLKTPTKNEAELLNGLVFDNQYSGHDKRYVLGRSKRGIWKEGLAVYKQNFPFNRDAIITLEKHALAVNGIFFPRRISTLSTLYKDVFVNAVSLLARESVSPQNQKKYVDMIKKSGKRYTAAKLLHDYGGILRAKISLLEKIKCYIYLIRFR